MAEASKDTIYIDIDDEITSVIEKVRDSKHKILALVLPKRATVFQSIVNMKLLKRTADEVGKRIVLITSEAGILPLAGAVGLHVAKTLQTKPYIPSAPEVPSSDVALDEPEETEAEEPELDETKPIGELAGAGAAGAAANRAAPEDTIELDEPDEPAAVEPAKTGRKAKKEKAKKDKKLAVPNFDRFRKRLFIAIGALISLIILWILANIVLPKAKVTVKTDTTTLNANVPFTASTTAKSLDEANAIVPAEQQQTKKTDTQKVTATGQKDIGTPATGTVSMTAQACAPNLGTPNNVPAGSSVITNNLTFVTQESTSFNFSHFSGGSCAVYTSNAWRCGI